jgi:hypothetical protein
MNESDINWLRNARIFAFEAWWPPFWPHLEIDWDKVLWTMNRLHLNTLQVNGLTKWAIYPTNLVQRHPELGNRDILQEAQDFCEEYGFRWIVYSLFGHPMPISTQLSKGALALFSPMLPDYDIQRDPGHLDTVPEEFQDYTTSWHFGGERYVFHCPFAAESWLLDIVGEMADRYNYDAAWLDGSVSSAGWVNHPFWNVCKCPTCQEAYLEDFKRPMPIIKNLTDPRLIQLRRWVMKRFDRLLNKVAYCFTKGRKVPLIGNMAAYQLDTIFFYPPIVKNLNGGLLEHVADQIELVRKISQARQLMETSIFYLDCYDPWPRMVTSGWEVENKGLTILAYGGTPYLSQPGKYYYDDSNDEPAKRIFTFMEKDFLSRQERYAYCVIPSFPSPSFLLPQAPPDAMSFHFSSARGWFSSMLDNHLPVSDLPFYLLEDKDRLNKYPVLVLPDVELMSDKALRNLYEFIQDGGGVYLSYNPARMDENLKRRDGNFLENLFDLHEQSLSREQLLRRHTFERNRYDQTYDVYLKVDETFQGDFPVPSKKIHPSHFGHTLPGSSWSIVTNLMPTDEDKPLAPGIAVKNIGKGKVVFSTVEWGRQYIERRDPSLGSWMRDVVLWLGNNTLPIRVKGSRLIQLGTTRVNSGWLLYLVNNSNDIQGVRTEWFELMKVAERPLPTGPVDIFVNGARKVKAIYGPEPDRALVQDDSLQIEYTNFKDHAVLHVY